MLKIKTKLIYSFDIYYTPIIPYLVHIHHINIILSYLNMMFTIFAHSEIISLTQTVYSSLLK